MSESTTYALDRSLRTTDQDGHLVVSMSRISKANVCPYNGSEIPNSEKLGLDPNKVYRLYRDPAEFKNGEMEVEVDGKMQKVRTGAWSADGKPLILRHKAITAETPSQELWVGTLGACTFEPPYLVTRPLTVITAEAQALIEADVQRELSAGYRYEPDMTPGTTPEGEPYDGRMTKLRFNHTALVCEGRAGSDVHVADESPLEMMSVKNRKLIARLQQKIPALANLKTAELLAFDEELSGKRVGEVPAESAVTLTKDEEMAACDAARDAKRKAHGADAELDDEERQKAIDEALEKKAKEVEDKKAADKKAADKKAADARKVAADKKAADARKRAHDAEEDKDETEAAADAAEEKADEEEEAEDSEKDDEDARDRRRARDERRRARDRRQGARDARKAARDALADLKDPRRDFRSGDSRRGADAAMTMDQVTRLVDTAVSRETAKVRAQVTAEQRALAIAVDEVAPLVGRLQLHAFDSAAEVYSFALDKIGAEVDEDFPEAALRTLVKNELRHREAVRKPTARREHAYDTSGSGFNADELFQRTSN
ncbi:MAG: DUF2213 domain-containing protein [Steroidobacteraceae bacterium]